MLKALLKKQFLELNAFLFRDRKTGKRRSKIGSALFALLFAFVFFSVGFMFFGFSTMLGDVLIPAGLDWLYFAMFGLMAMFLGVFGSVFSTYSGLYQAKDNELLLSMPIPPSKILFVRMTGVYAMSLLYTALVWVPTLIEYWLMTTPSALSAVYCVLLTFVMSLGVLVLTCLLGWVIALIASKVKNKSAVTVALTILFLAAYYFVYFRMSGFLQSALANINVIGSAIEKWGYPIRQLGLAATGETVPMLIFTAINVLLFAAAYYVMTRSFIRLITEKRSGKKAVYKEGAVKVSGVGGALLRKELKRFTSTSVYMLNGGLGMLVMPVLAVVTLVKRGTIIQIISNVFGPLGFSALVPLAAAAAIGVISSMDCITPPSVSLEGKSIWILQSMPLPAWEVLKAKLRLALVLHFPVIAVTAVLLGIALCLSALNTALVTVFGLMFYWLMASVGLMLNLLKPTLEWTSETVPVKQGAPVAITLFGGWLIAAAFGAGGWFLFDKLDTRLYIALCCAFIAAVCLLLRRWLKTKGAKIFSIL